MATVSGDTQLYAAMNVLQKSGTARLDPLGRAALQPMQNSAKAKAMTLRQEHNPPGGHLDQGIVIAKIPNQSTGVREFWLTLTARARKIGHLVEFGTAPHYQPRRKRMHPGARPEPYMTPAFEANKGEAVAIVAEGFWASIQAAAVALSGGVKR